MSDTLNVDACADLLRFITGPELESMPIYICMSRDLPRGRGRESTGAALTHSSLDLMLKGHLENIGQWKGRGAAMILVSEYFANVPSLRRFTHACETVLHEASHWFARPAWLPSIRDDKRDGNALTVFGDMLANIHLDSASSRPVGNARAVASGANPVHEVAAAASKSDEDDSHGMRFLCASTILWWRACVMPKSKNMFHLSNILSPDDSVLAPKLATMFEAQCRRIDEPISKLLD